MKIKRLLQRFDYWEADKLLRVENIFRDLSDILEYELIEKRNISLEEIYLISYLIIVPIELLAIITGYFQKLLGVENGL